MNFKQLISKLDEISNPYADDPAQSRIYQSLSPEDQRWMTRGGGKPDLTDPYILGRAPNKGKQSRQTGIDNSSEMDRHVTRLNNIYNKLQAAIRNNPNESFEFDIANQLIESFGYDINEAGEPGMWDKIKQGGKKMLGPSIGIAIGVYAGWTQIEELPKTLTKQQYKQEVTKIIAKLVAEYGVFWVGGVFGGIIGGALGGGIGAIPGFIAGGFAADYAAGDDVSEIVGAVVDYAYKDAKQPETIQALALPTDNSAITTPLKTNEPKPITQNPTPNLKDLSKQTATDTKPINPPAGELTSNIPGLPPESKVQDAVRQFLAANDVNLPPSADTPELLAALKQVLINSGVKLPIEEV